MTSDSPTKAAIQAALDASLGAGAPGAIIAVDAPMLGVAFSAASGLFAQYS